MKQKTNNTKRKNNCEDPKTSNKNRKRTQNRSSKAMKESYDDFGYEERFKSKGSNDPRWYATEPSLLRDSASIPFSWPVGTDINLEFPRQIQPSISADWKYSIPGVQVEYLIPTVGWSTDNASPINVAAQAMYSFVRHANSGSANYDPADLMLYVLSMSQVYSYINWMQRLYGLATLYANENRYLPDILVESQGCDAKGLREQLANFRYRLNVMINKAAAMAVPADITLFQRHAFIYKDVYIEGTSIKNQLYMYAPIGFWRYQQMTDKYDNAGYLEFKPLPAWQQDLNGSWKYTFSTNVMSILEYGEDLLNRIMSATNEDFGIMSGDILKAYGPGNIIKLATLPEVYNILPMFNVGVLEQMKNATIVSHTGRFEVYPDKNKTMLRSTPAYRGSITKTDTMSVPDICASMLAGSKILTTTTQDTSPELVIESTRLMTQVTALGADFLADEADNEQGVLSEILNSRLYTGTEICVSCQMWAISPRSAANPNETFWLGNVKYEVAAPQYFTVAVDWYTSIIRNTYEREREIQFINRMACGSNFDFHPLCWIMTTIGLDDNDKYRFAGIIGDIDNYAVLSAQDIIKLHQTAIMNELHVPSVAKSILT